MLLSEGKGKKKGGGERRGVWGIDDELWDAAVLPV